MPNPVRPDTLIAAAAAVCKPLKLRRDLTAATVGAAIQSASGTVYTGVCIDLACGLGFCAEASAAAEMLKHGETAIAAVVAIDKHGAVLPPCGRCREMMAQLDERNLDTRVLLASDHHVALRTLLPEFWMDAKRSS